jgi:putative ABC transport system permease protein
MRNMISMALKNISRSGKRSRILGANYAIVAFLLTLLFSFSRGASTNVSSSIVLASAGHITVSGQYAKAGRIYNGMLREPDIERITRDTLGPGVRVLPRYRLQSSVYYRGLSKRLAFTGIDAKTDTGLRGQMTFASGSWEAWAGDPSGVILPESAAAYFGIASGEDLVIAARTRFGAFNTGILKVRGVFKTDNYFMRELVITHLDFLRSLDLSSPDSATTLYVYLPRPSDAGRAREALSLSLAKAGFEVSRPKNDNEAISAVSAASVKYEADKENRDRVMLKLSTLDEVLGIVKGIVGAVNAVGAFVAAVMLFVIAVSIFINLRMSISERLREIGTMRAIGAESSFVTALFVTESSALAFISSAAGSILGAVAALGVRAFLYLSAGGNLAILMSSGRLALEPRALDMALVVLSITALAAAFSYFPARRGGRISPVQALSSNT